MFRVLIILLMFSSTSAFGQSSMDWINDKQRGTKKEKILTPGINIETELIIKAPEEEKSLVCTGEVSLLYSQLDTIVEVETEINNEDCGASFGNYTLRIKTRNEAGETTTTNHTESWSRENSNPVSLVKNYSMNGDVDLASVRVRASFNDLCTCKEDE